MRLRDRGILITGAGRGLGQAIARACVAEGAHVFLCARSAEELERTRAELAAQARPGQAVLAAPADVSKPAQAQRLLDAAAQGLPRFDGLVNNAGVIWPIGPLEEVDWDLWTQAISINLLGTVFLCRGALPLMRRRGRGKIVNISGGGATAPMPHFSAYAASKAAVIRFTETLAQEVAGAGIDVNAVAPGPLNTRLLEDILAAGQRQAGENFYRNAQKQKAEGGVAPEQAAELCVFLLSSESDGITGRLISAIWDPWKTLAARRQELADSDIYTLRRIVPKDRDLDWE